MSSNLAAHSAAGVFADAEGMKNRTHDNCFRVPTLSGEEVDLVNPCVNSIRVIDIATGLSNTCRYAGQVSSYYSVAQHSVLLSDMVSHKIAPYALLHDGAEAYMHDLGPAIKMLVGSIYRPLEDRLQHAIYSAFGLSAMSPEELEALKRADRQIAQVEMRWLRFGSEPSIAGELSFPPDVVPLDPVRAKEQFLDRFHELFS